MIRLEPFGSPDFDRLIKWIDSKELLVQIAGSYFSYPLDTVQLQKYLDDKNSLAFNIVEVSSKKVIGHSEIIRAAGNSCKLDKILIGDSANRGKGIGRHVIQALLACSFENLKAGKVELNVYDWNIGAIKTYERAGFVINHDKTMSTEIDGKTWIALNMVIDQEKYKK